MRALPAPSRWVSAAGSPSGGSVPSTAVRSPPSTSTFQIGASALIRSIASRAPANASPRCGAETATTTLGSPSGTVPVRCSAAAASSPCAARHSPRIAVIRSLAISAYASYSRLSTSRVVPQKTTIAPDPGRLTAPARASTESGSGPTLAVIAVASPPLTGGISASSSPSPTGASSPTYSRLRAARTGIRSRISPRPGSRPAASITSATVAPSGTSSVRQSRPARSRRTAKSLSSTFIELHRRPKALARGVLRRAIFSKGRGRRV